MEVTVVTVSSLITAVQLVTSTIGISVGEGSREAISSSTDSIEIDSSDLEVNAIDSQTTNRTAVGVHKRDLLTLSNGETEHGEIILVVELVGLLFSSGSPGDSGLDIKHGPGFTITRSFHLPRRRS